MGDILDSIGDRIASVQRDLAELEERDAAVASLVSSGTRRRPGSSVVYSVRLDPAEVSALETAAAMRGLKPSVLARNLIRMGLSMPQEDAVSKLVDRLSETMQELRAIVPR
ncbi:MAG: hypothetical protein ABI232_04980 [Jatrophihabitantaceae bacterium]